jgi:hypothetical protein
MEQPIGRLTTTAHWRAALLPQWSLIGMSLLLQSPYRITYEGFPLFAVLNAAKELQEASAK